MSTLFKFPTSYAEFLQGVHPKNMVIAFSHIKSIDDSISKTRITLQGISDTYGGDMAVDYMIKWLDALNESLNITRKLENTPRIAFMIVDRFAHLYLTDLKLVYDKIMYGDGVRFYGSVDAQAILGAFSDYNAQRVTSYNKILAEMGEKYQDAKKAFIEEEKNKLWALTVELPNEERVPEFMKLCHQKMPAIEQAFNERLFQKQADEAK